MQNATAPIVPNEIDTYVTHGYADNHGVNIHYANLGEGPLIVMIHGFPDFWYTWRNQMVALAPHFQVVALDLRGYNLSDKPQGGEHYSMRYLIGDVQAIIGHLGRDKPTGCATRLVQGANVTIGKSRRIYEKKTAK